MMGIKTMAYVRHISIKLGRYVSPSLFAALGVLAVTFFALFVKPLIGMADNGDYFRILYSNGLYFNAPDYDSQYLGYFIKDYGVLQYYNENGLTLSSSQSLFIRLSLFVSELFGNSVTFDIRYQAAIFTVLYVAAVYLLVESVTWKLRPKLGYSLAALAIFMFGDTGYTAFFNSFYSESVVLIAMLYVFASVLLLYRHRYNVYVLTVLFGLSALVLTTSKQQNAPVGIILAFAGIYFVFIRKGRAYRMTMGLVLAGLLAAGIGTYALIPQEFVNINKYHAMTRGVLLSASDPEAALESFGIDKQYALLKGTVYYDPYAAIDVDSPQLQEQFYDKYGFGSILLYYITHPAEANHMLQLAAQEAFTIRPGAMGNYEKSAGKPFGAQTIFFSAYSWLKDMFTPKTFGFIVIWMIVVIGLYMPSTVTAIKERRPFPLPLLATMMLVGLSGIAVSIIGAGDADLAKHEFLFTLAFDLVSFLTVSELAAGTLWGSRPVRQEEPVPESKILYKSARI